MEGQSQDIQEIDLEIGRETVQGTDLEIALEIVSGTVTRRLVVQLK